MDETDLDARIAGLVRDLMRARRILDAATFGDLLGALSVDLDIGLEIALERHSRGGPADNVVLLPGAARTGFEARGEREEE